MTDADTVADDSGGGIDLESEMRASSPVDDLEPRHRWLTVAWPLALLFHLMGNSAYLIAMFNGQTTIVALLQIIVAFLAILYLVRPRPPYMFGLSLVFLLVTFFKAPIIGNHEVILAVAALIVMLSVMTTDRLWPARALPLLRWLLIIAYGAIAISKLNTSFFDPAVSCAVVFGDELSGRLGFMVSNHRSLSVGAIWITAVIELSIPVLLVVRRLRLLGVLVAMAFHYVLALEPVGHVFDFTATLYPLFLAFAPVEVREGISDRLDGVGGGRGRAAVALAAVVVFAAHLGVLVVDLPVWIVAYPAWLVAGTTALWWVLSATTARIRGTAGWEGDRVTARGPLPILVPIVALLIANAVAPYLQWRTAAAFNMYSNLETVHVDGNHLLFGNVAGPGPHDLVQIVDAPDDHPLAHYRDGGRAVPAENLRWFRYATLLTEPAEEVERADAEVELNWVTSAVADPPARLSDLEPAVGGWRTMLAHKFGFVRAVDLSSSAGCLRTWGPAG